MAAFTDASAYDAFMGRYSRPLAPLFLDRCKLPTSARVLDVGSGPGALTEELVRRYGADRVLAVDPSPPFVAAVQARLPGVEARKASAEALPFDDASFDGALAQLVVHFMQDPVAGLREMARVTRRGGVVAATTWDLGGDRAPFSVFGSAVQEADPLEDGAELPGTRAGRLADLFRTAGLEVVDDGDLTVRRTFASFEEWWHPFTLGVGPAGDRWNGLTGEQRSDVRARCAELLGAPPFEVAAAAWCVVARVA